MFSNFFTYEYIFDNNFLDSVDNLSISDFWFSDELTTKFTDDATENTDDVEDILDGQESNKNTGEMAGEKFVSSGAVSTLDISMRLLWTLIKLEERNF